MHMLLGVEKMTSGAQHIGLGYFHNQIILVIMFYCFVQNVRLC